MASATLLMGLWVLAASPASLAAAATVEEDLRACDALALSEDPATRDYTCYGKVARAHSWDEVAPHLRAQALAHPNDGQLWLALGAAEADFDDDPKPSLRRAIEVLAAEGKPGYQIQAQLNLVRRLRDDGRPREAKALLAEATELAQTLKHPVLSAIVVFEQSAEAGQLLDADLQSAYRNTLDAYNGLPQPSPYMVRVSGLSALARIARAQGHFAESRRRSLAAAELARSVGDHHTSLFGDIAAAGDALALGRLRHDPDSAQEFHARFAELLEAARKYENPRAELSALRSAARSERGPGREALWLRCEALAGSLQHMPARQTCAVGRALDLVRTDLAAADRLSAQILAATEASDPSAMAEAHQARGHVLWAMGQHEAAWSEWLAMLDASEAGEAQQSSDDGAARLHAQWIDRYKLMAGSALSQTSDSSLWHSRAFSVMERMRGRRAKQVLVRSGIEVTASTQEVSLAEVQASLSADEAIAIFQLGRERSFAGSPLGGSWLLLIEAGRTQAFPLRDTTELAPRIEMFGAAVAGSTDDVLEGGSLLYEQLLAQPLRSLAPSVRSLTFVPDEGLHRLPFGALGPSDSPLVATYATATIPSVGLWLEQRHHADQPVRRALVGFADPSPSSVLPAAWNGRPPSRLPGARAEVVLAADTLGNRSTTYFGEDASETTLRELRSTGVLHIAAHAIVDHEHPESAAVLLASDSVNDGSLGMADLTRLDLQGSIVVLAACQGADGEVLAGEGAMSPARALFLGGARAVVAGLWPVRDDEAAAFFAEFYPALDQGMSVAAALAHAGNERRLAGAPPSAWAGFVVYGDGSATLAPRTRPGRPWFVVLAAALAALAGWWLAR